MFTPATNVEQNNPLTSVDAIIAGVDSLLLHPANFSNYLGDVYECFFSVQEEHQNYISLFDVDRMLRRGKLRFPKDTKENEFSGDMVGVGSIKMARIVPSDLRIPSVPIEIVPLKNLMNYRATLCSVNDPALPQRIPSALAWWNDGSVGRITLSDTFDSDAEITFWYEPTGKTDLKPEAPANVLQNAFSYIKSEIALRLLDIFFPPGSPAYAGREKAIKRQNENAAAILDQWLSEADEEESGFVAGFGRASNLNGQQDKWGWG